MATAISDTWTALSLSNTDQFLGVSLTNDASNVILTDSQSVSIYKVSDQQTVQSFTLKSDVSFCLATVFDYEEENYVGLVEHFGKRRLCVWSDEMSDYKDWKKKLLLTEVTALIEVDNTEPLVVKSDDSICWLSNVEDSSHSFQLLPGKLKGEDVEIDAFKCYRYGSRTDLVYVVHHNGNSLVYHLQFNNKQVFGEPTQLFTEYTNVTCICKCLPYSESSYLATTGEGEIVRATSTSVEVLHTLSSQLSTQSVLLQLLDSDQLLISMADATKHTGVLLIFSMKFRTVRVIKRLDSELCGDSPLTLLPPYILTQTERSLQVHAYKFTKLTLRSMLGSMTVSSADTTAADKDLVAECMKSLELHGKKSPDLSEHLDKYDKSTLMDALCSYSSINSINWSSVVVQQLLSSLVLPSHVILAVSEAAVRHADSKVVEYLIFGKAELPEQAIVSLLGHLLKSVSQPGDMMDTDDDEIQFSGSQSIPSQISSAIDALLSKEMTDIYATEAIRKIDTSLVLTLLRHLNTLLSDDADTSSTLTDGQICKWCAVILDAHYTELILSNQAELLVQLHENVRLQVELHSNVLKLGANLLCKPPESKPSTGPYCIEAVTFYY